MNPHRRSIRLFGVIAFLALTVPAGAQDKARPALRIEGCTALLRLAEAAYNQISDDTEQLTKVKAERALLMGQPSAAPAAGATPEIVKIYDTQIGKIEAGIQSKRKVIAAAEKVYRDCIRTPPQARAEAEELPAKRTPAKRD